MAKAVRAATAFLALVLAGCSASGGHPHFGGRHGTSVGAPRTPGGAPVHCPAPSPATAFGDQRRLAQSVTDAIQRHDRAAFLALAGTPAVKAKLSTWWENVSAAGFTTGGAAATALPPKMRDTKLTIGLHNALDSWDSSDRRLPMTAATDYDVTLGHAGAGCRRVVVTGWRSLWDAPWDTSQRLYVVHTRHTVVAGEPAMRSEVNRIAPMAERAAVWDLAFFHFAQQDHYVQQKGFVVFVAASNQEAGTWFRPATAPKPKGWASDPASVAGFMFPPPGVSMDVRAPVQELADGGVGAGRVVINPAGRSGSEVSQEAVLVHEFVHALLNVHDLWAWSGRQANGTAATVEGAARWVEGFFYSSPAAPGPQMNEVAWLRSAIEPHLAQFRGTVPSDTDLYGGRRHRGTTPMTSRHPRSTT